MRHDVDDCKEKWAKSMSSIVEDTLFGTGSYCRANCDILVGEITDKHREGISGQGNDNVIVRIFPSTDICTQKKYHFS